MENKFEIGDIVRIQKEWLGENENPTQDYVVIEVLYPYRGIGDRNVKIYTKSEVGVFGTSEMVSYEMIYKVGHIDLNK